MVSLKKLVKKVNALSRVTQFMNFSKKEFNEFFLYVSIQLLSTSLDVS